MKNKSALTKREKQLLEMFSQGKTSIECAKELYLSYYTVETHRKNIFRKTETNSVIGLVKYAYEHRLI